MFARSTEMGHARTSNRGMSNEYGSHAFFCYHLSANAEGAGASVF